MKYKYTKEELEKAVEKSKSIAEVCRELNIRPAGGNYKTLHKKIKNFNINISHFTGRGWNIGLKFIPNPPKPLEEILVEDSNYTNSGCLKRRLIKEKILENVCNYCGIDKWNEKEISLELHHINGNNFDHRIENLVILCPNCHSQTKNYRGRNKKI